MFEKLLIQNFQKHEKLCIDFDPGITCVVGPTDMGKSAIIRALRWTCTNQPTGNEFVKHNTKGTTVKLIVDGHTVTRRRSSNGSVNEYKLDKHLYKAFGTKVPEPIEELLNLGTMCWQQQHDAPYWFAETAGEVSRQLNAIVNLGIIDHTLTAVGRALNKARTKLELAEEALAEAKGNYDKLKLVPEYTEALAVVEDKAGAYREAEETADGLCTAVTHIQTYRGVADKAGNVAESGDIAVHAGALVLELRTKAKLLSELVTAATHYSNITTTKVPSLIEAEKAIAVYEGLKEELEVLNGLVSHAQDKEEEICQHKKQIAQIEKAMPKVCPTCGQSL